MDTCHNVQGRECRRCELAIHARVSQSSLELRLATNLQAGAPRRQLGGGCVARTGTRGLTSARRRTSWPFAVGALPPRRFCVQYTHCHQPTTCESTQTRDVTLRSAGHGGCSAPRVGARCLHPWVSFFVRVPALRSRPCTATPRSSFTMQRSVSQCSTSGRRARCWAPAGPSPSRPHRQSQRNVTAAVQSVPGPSDEGATRRLSSPAMCRPRALCLCVRSTSRATSPVGARPLGLPDVYRRASHPPIEDTNSRTIVLDCA
jgi:hypothetical protein